MITGEQAKAYVDWLVDEGVLNRSATSVDPLGYITFEISSNYISWFDPTSAKFFHSNWKPRDYMDVYKFLAMGYHYA